MIIQKFLVFIFQMKIGQRLKSLSIINLCRLIEVVLLSKASQSGTERAMSQIKKIATRYQNIYCYGCKNKDGIDMINVLVFLKLNEGIYEFDKSLANEKFSKKHTDTLLKSKPIYYKSLSHKRKLNITDPSEKNAKKKKKLEQLS